MPPIVIITLSYVSGVIAQKLLCLPLALLIFSLVILFILSFASISSKKMFLCSLIFLILFAGMTSFAIRGEEQPEFSKKVDVPSRLDRFRDRFAEVPGKILQSPYSDLLGSMIFGTKVVKPPEEIGEAFRRTGTVHLLVASGLHLSILMGSLLALLKFLSIPGRIGPIVSAAFGLLYVLMVGAGASVVRAFIMACMTVLAGAIGREKDALSALCLAALILLILNPSNLFKIGFQLSFAATFALLYVAPIIEEKLPEKLPRLIRIPLSVSIAPFLLTMPIILYYFSQFSVVSVLVNALIISWVGYTIILGFCAVSLGAIFTPLAHIFSGALFLFLAALKNIVCFFANLPFAAFFIKPPSLLLVFGYYAGLAAVLHMIKNKESFKFNKSRFLIVSLMVASVVVWHVATLSGSGIAGDVLKITMIDVGQGDSIFVSTPSGKKILIDGGDKYGGRRYVFPFLRSAGVNRLDMVILTHPHGDHIGGLPEVLRKIKVDLVLDSGQEYESSYYKNFLNLVEKNRIKYRVTRIGDVLDFGDGVKAGILGPSAPLFEGTNSDPNNNSIVMRLIYGNFSMLFVGDLEKEGEERLIESGANLDSDILKVGHHGSKTSSGLNFLGMVKPEMAVISVGAKNKFGHPAEQTIERLEEAGTKIFRTDKCGTIVIKANGDEYVIFEKGN
jgi:competence protein ComEC